MELLYCAILGASHNSSSRSTCVSQLSVIVTNIWDNELIRRKRFILAHGIGRSSPWAIGCCFGACGEVGHYSWGSGGGGEASSSVTSWERTSLASHPLKDSCWWLDLSLSPTPYKHHLLPIAPSWGASPFNTGALGWHPQSILQRFATHRTCEVLGLAAPASLGVYLEELTKSCQTECRESSFKENQFPCTLKCELCYESRTL